MSLLPALRRELPQRRVVVTGLGLISPVGTGVERNWERLLQGLTGIRALTAEDLPDSHRAAFPNLRSKVAGVVNTEEFLDYDWTPGPELQKGLPKNHTRASVFALAAAAEALQDARFGRSSSALQLNQQRAGVSFGVGLPSVWQGARAGFLVSEGRPHQLPDQLLARLLVGAPSSHVALSHGLSGPLKAHTTACSAGAHAIGDAWRHVREGDADIMVAGGAESCIDAVTIAGFTSMRAMASNFNKKPREASRPFDGARDGFVIGEGAGVLVLEEMEHAHARGARVYAEPDPGGVGAIAAMNMALHRGSMPADKVVYVNAHAASTPIGDQIEQLAISKVFGDRATGSSSDSHPLLVSSTKGATGHLLGAAGAVEAVITVLALVHRKAPPTLNLRSQKPKLLAGIIGHGAPKPLPNGPIAVMSNSFGFGGTNAALLFAAPPRVKDW